MTILGIDPGTLVTGYGVIASTGSKMTVVEYGTIESKKIAALPARLGIIFTRLTAVIERVEPDELAIETAFYHKNVQSTLKLGHARGVAMLAGILKDITAAEYSPREVKRAVVGNGNASKDQVEYMVRTMLQLKPSDKKLSDAYDALAVAITHASRVTNGTKSVDRKRGGNGWAQFIAMNPDRVKK